MMTTSPTTATTAAAAAQPYLDLDLRYPAPLSVAAAAQPYLDPDLSYPPLYVPSTVSIFPAGPSSSPGTPIPPLVSRQLSSAPSAAFLENPDGTLCVAMLQRKSPFEDECPKSGTGLGLVNRGSSATFDRRTSPYPMDDGSRIGAHGQSADDPLDLDLDPVPSKFPPVEDYDIGSDYDLISRVSSSGPRTSPTATTTTAATVTTSIVAAAATASAEVTGTDKSPTDRHHQPTAVSLPSCPVGVILDHGPRLESASPLEEVDDDARLLRRIAESDVRLSRGLADEDARFLMRGVAAEAGGNLHLLAQEQQAYN